VEGLQTQLSAALKSSEIAEASAKQQTYDLEAAYRRADAAEAEARRLRTQLEEARCAASAAAAQAAQDVAAAAEEVTRSEEARGEADRRLAEAVHAKDVLQTQLEALMAAAAGSGQELPTAPTGVPGGGFGCCWGWVLLGLSVAGVGCYCKCSRVVVHGECTSPPQPNLTTAHNTTHQARVCLKHWRRRARTESTLRGVWRC